MNTRNVLIASLVALAQPVSAQEPAQTGLWYPVCKERSDLEGAAPHREARVAPEASEAPDSVPGVAHFVPGTPGIDAERVYFDRPGDGALWARGRTYKARFDEAGALFSPYLGPAAEGPRPVMFRIDEVTLGERSLDFARSAPASLAPAGQASGVGDVVSFDRGSFVEHYVMAPDSMEQRFRFDVPLADGVGDLLVKLRVDTSLAARESAEGLSFDGARGSVQYGRAVAFDARGERVDAPTTLIPGGLEIRVPADFLAGAEYPLTIDPVISTFSLDTSGFVDLEPDIAYEHQSGRYMVIWQRLFNGSDWDVFGQMYNSLGNPIAGSDRYIDITDDSWADARVASNSIATQFLVVAVEDEFRIVGRTREAESTTQGQQFFIASPIFGSSSSPDVGGDPHFIGPTYYCVTWQYTSPSSETNIQTRLVATDSSLPGPTLVLSENGPSDTKPQVSNSNGQPPASSQRWTIVWEHRASLGASASILGAQLTWDGALTPRFPISASLFDSSVDPSVSSLLDGQTGSRAYLVAFERENGGQPDILGRVMRDSTPVTSTLNLTALQGFNVLEEQNKPCVEADGSSFVVVNGEYDSFTGNDIYVGTLNLSGSTLVPVESHVAFTTAAGSQFNPRIASMHSGGGFPGLYMGVWRTAVGLGGGDIHAGRYITPGPGDVYCTSNPNTTGSVGTLRANGSISIAKATFSLLAESCPPNKPGLFFLGPNQIDAPFGAGRRCVGGQTKRIVPVATTDGQGRATRLLNFGLPYGAGVFPGPGGVNYQFWFRDPAGGSGDFNLTNALHVEHTP